MWSKLLRAEGPPAPPERSSPSDRASEELLASAVEVKPNLQVGLHASGGESPLILLTLLVRGGRARRCNARHDVSGAVLRLTAQPSLIGINYT